MVDPVADGYDAYYADKLWQLLPAAYRSADGNDPESKGPLREMVERIGAQAAVVRRSIDRLWEDQSIESCDDWVISYLADLLATNLVPSLDARGQRLDVAKTIYYRRRKGTRALLEELAADTTGWDARIVEFFQRLARTRHRLDPPFGWPLEVAAPDGTPTPLAAQGLIGTLTRTLMGGYADLRSAYGAIQAGTSFEEFFRTVDVRAGQGASGWHNISRLGVFLWRVDSIPVDGVTPVVDANCPNQVTFDPTGRDLQLFAASSRAYGNEWVSPAEKDLPTPIRPSLLNMALEDLYAGMTPSGDYAPNSLRIYSNGQVLPENVVPVSSVTADPRNFRGLYFIDPSRGRLFLPAGIAPSTVLIGYHYGFSSTIGAGGYDRRLAGQASGAPQDALIVQGGGDAIESLPSYGTVIIADSLTYTSVPSVLVSPGAVLVVMAENGQRPVIRPPLPSGSTTLASWTFVGQVDGNGVGSQLVLDGLFLNLCDLVLQGDFDTVTIRTCTIDPGSASRAAADGRALDPGHLRISARVRNLVIDRCILGPIVMDADPTIAELESASVKDSIVQGTPLAIDLRTGLATIQQTTVLGPTQVHTLEASNAIFSGAVTVDNLQQGCTRFTAYPATSSLPRPYECQPLAQDQNLFVSTEFGNYAFAQLLASVDAAIGAGADDGSEMGAFHREKAPIKERSLLIKYQEYMPVGLTPVVIRVT
jgi:hypothetical protein